MSSPLNLAIQDLRVQENPSGSNKVKYNTWYYGKVVSGNAYPWCMTAVQYWYNEAGCTLPYKTASCSALLNWYKKYQPECVINSPQPNDIVIYSWGHTGIFERFYDSQQFYTIEGNTAIGNDSNGGEVMRRLRKLSEVSAFIHPKTLERLKNGEKTMNVIKGSTTNEIKMVKAIQTAVGANADGEIGTQTLSDIACKLRANCFPLTLKIYNVPVIIAKNILPFSGNGTKLGDWTNCINGSFYAGKKPCSILIQDGVVKQKYACHYFYNKPETVLYKLVDGSVDIKRVLSTNELPSGIVWAVGGVGLLNNYNPTAEGFCKCTANGKTEDFSDVIRTTNHSMLGYKQGYMYLVYCPNMSGAQVNDLAKKLGLEKAIMLDGGHVAGINGTEDFAKINTKSTPQYYIIQAIVK